MVSQGSTTATIIRFDIVTDLTAGLSYNKEKTDCHLDFGIVRLNVLFPASSLVNFRLGYAPNECYENSVFYGHNLEGFKYFLVSIQSSDRNMVIARFRDTVGQNEVPLNSECVGLETGQSQVICCEQELTIGIIGLLQLN